MRGRTPEIDDLALSHGQARLVLKWLDLSVGEDDQTFDAYIKSLRRDGVPFAPEELGVGAGYNLTYKYVHLMELAVVLGLRTQGILSRHIVRRLALYRSDLRPLYRRAWLERDSELGEPRDVVIESDTCPEKLCIWGTYLDLGLTFREDGTLVGSKPRLLGPVAALKDFAKPRPMFHSRPPLPVSQYAESIVILARNVSEIKRGRRS
jgi:hypothetical protein